MPLSSDDVLALLAERGLTYEIHEHPPVLTVEAMMEVCSGIAGAHTKNLFLRDGKKTYFLVTLRHDAQVDLKAFRALVGARGGLSFASADALREQLGVEAGAVSPLAALNAEPDSVKIYLEEALTVDERINVHPLVSTRTVSISPEDLLTLLRARGHEPHLFSVPQSGAELIA